MASTQEPVNSPTTASALKATDARSRLTDDAPATTNTAMNGATIHANERRAISALSIVPPCGGGFAEVLIWIAEGSKVIEPMHRNSHPVPTFTGCTTRPGPGRPGKARRGTEVTRGAEQPGTEPRPAKPAAAASPAALAHGVRTLVPLVQVPPRAIWGAAGQARHTSAESWPGGRPAPPRWTAWSS